MRDADRDRRRELERHRLLETADELVGGGRWMLTAPTGELVWSDNAFRVYGLEPGEIEPSVDWVMERIHPDDRQRVASTVRKALESGYLAPLEYRFVRDDGSVRLIHAVRAIAEERDGRPYRLVGWMRDITEERRAERQIAAHIAVSEALAGWSSFQPGMRRLLAGLCQALDLDAGVLWAPEGDRLVLRCFWGSAAAELQDFEAAVRRERPVRGVGLPGLAWERGEPVAPGDGVAFPARDAREVLAVVELAGRLQISPSERLLRSLTGIGYEIGHFLDRHRADLERPRLTARELEVLQLAAHGLAGPKIAERLVVSHATVRSHFENIYGKLDVCDKASAVATALRSGAIS